MLHVCRSNSKITKLSWLCQSPAQFRVANLVENLLILPRIEEYSRKCPCSPELFTTKFDITSQAKGQSINSSTFLSLHSTTVMHLIASVTYTARTSPLSHQRLTHTRSFHLHICHFCLLTCTSVKAIKLSFFSLRPISILTVVTQTRLIHKQSHHASSSHFDETTSLE